MKTRYETTREQYQTGGIEALKRIEELTGLKRSTTQVEIFLKKLGLKRLKTAAVPAKFDANRQETLKKRAGAEARASQSREADGLVRQCGPYVYWEPIWADCGVLYVYWCGLPVGDGGSTYCEP